MSHPIFQTNHACPNNKWTISHSCHDLDDVIHFHLWMSRRGVNPSEEQRGRSSDALVSRMWGAFITEVCTGRATPFVWIHYEDKNGSSTDTSVFTNLCCITDEVFTAERHDAALELNMTHADAGGRRGDLHHIQPWCEFDFIEDCDVDRRLSRVLFVFYHTGAEQGCRLGSSQDRTDFIAEYFLSLKTARHKLTYDFTYTYFPRTYLNMQMQSTLDSATHNIHVWSIIVKIPFM